MAFTFGFYNALNHDRRYNAIQVSSIFDGIIKDGIFMSIGGHMNVKATGNGFNIVVESGRAWFNHTWSLLDADYPMVVSPSDVLEDRIDVVVLEVNENVDVRQNFIKIIAGTPAEHPTKPALTNNLDIHQYALAYITVPANSVTLTQSNVENAVGLGSTPFVTGILETINIDDLIAQWKSQWSDWTEEVDLNWNNWFDTVDNAWTTWFTQQQSKWEDILADRAEEWEEIKDTVDSEWASQQGSINSDYTNWKSSALASYNQWLDQIKGTLDDDAATQLAKEVVELKNRDDVISTYQHVKSGTEHMFIGSGSNGKVKMTADIASGDKVVISSAPKEKVTVEGATSQPGSGDPSPKNIRMIDGVGMYDKMIVLDGNANWLAFGNTPGVYLADALINIKTINDSTVKTNSKKYTDHYPVSDLKQSEFLIQNFSDRIRVIVRVDANSTSVQTAKDYFNRRPLTVWIRSIDFYKCKGPFYYVHEVSDGTESPYKAIGIELNAPLFDGDSLEIGGPSGFDKMVVLDGSSDEHWVAFIGSSDVFYIDLLPEYGLSEGNASGVKVNRLKYKQSATIREDEFWFQSTSVTSVSTFRFVIRVNGAGTNVQTVRNALGKAPLIIFYKSVNYTPEADIAVALEKRVNGYAVFDGEEPIATDSTGSMVLFSVPLPNPSSLAFDDPDSVISSHYPYKNVSSDNTLDGGVRLAMGSDSLIIRDSNNFGTSEELSSLLSDQYDLRTPVQLVYELASAATYAHPIQAESLPAYYGTEDFVTALAGEPVTDKWLTFTNDGTQLNFKGGGGVGVSKLAATTAVPADVVSGKTFYSKDKTLKTGTLTENPALTNAVSVGNDGSYLYVRIPVGAYRTRQAIGYPEVRFPNAEAIKNIPGGDNGAWSGTYSGSNVTIPQGYHNGNGSVSVSGGNRGNWSGTYSGSNVTIPKGYHNGSGSVSVAGGNRGNWNGTYSGSDVTIPQGYHAGGGKVSVSGGNKGAWGSTINPGGSVTIPKGYHNGSGVVKANGNSINLHPIDRTVGWGSGVRFTGEDATPGASGKMRFVLKYWCRTEYNVNGYIKVLRNGSEIHSTTFNKNYDSPYNDDVPNGYINVEFSGSGTYQIQVSVDYNAGNGEIKMGGAFIGY